MTRIFRRIAIVALIGSATGALLAGCAGAAPADDPAPAATPEPVAATRSPEPTPTAEPDPLDAVTALVMRPTEAELVGADGEVVASIDYLAPAGPSIALLTQVLGTEPVVADWPGTNHFPPATTHEWDGLTLVEQRLVDGWEDRIAAPSYQFPALLLRAESDRVAGVEVRTQQGFAVGDPWGSLTGDPVFDADLQSCSGRPVETAEVGDGTAVVVGPDDATGIVREISAPAALLPGCV